MAKLTIREWIERYEGTTAAKQTALVYTLEKRVYMSLLETMKGLPMTICKRTKNGEEYETLRLDLKQIDLLHLRDKGAALLGTANDFFREWNKEQENKGQFVERKVIERYHGIKSKNGTAYYMAGDAIIAGIETQIKYQDGTLSRLDTIRKAYNNKKRKEKKKG